MSSDDRRKELEAELAALDADDEDDRVKIGRPDGSYFEGTYRRAKHLGYVTEPAKDDQGDSKDAKVSKGRFEGGRRVS
jgi:hypothetical protein